MPEYSVSLPSASVINFTRDVNGEQVSVLRQELVYLDAMLVSSQKSAKKMRSNEDDRLWWLPTFTNMLNTKFGVDLSQTEAHTIAVAIHNLGNEVKKNLLHTASSLKSMESIRSNSTPSNSKDSTSTSKESELPANSMPGWETAD